MEGAGSQLVSRFKENVELANSWWPVVRRELAGTWWPDVRGMLSWPTAGGWIQGECGAGQQLVAICYRNLKLAGSRWLDIRGTWSWRAAGGWM